MQRARSFAALFVATALVGVNAPGARAVEPEAPERLIDRQYVTLIAVRDELSGEEKKHALPNSEGASRLLQIRGRQADLDR